MKHLSDVGIIPNYYHDAQGNADDDGDEANCRRCGKRFKTGDEFHGWPRYPNQAVHLPRSIELCGKCNADITALKQLGR